MFTPRELFRAQGFPDGYQIRPWVDAHEHDGKPVKAGYLSKTAQIDACGNSVPPAFARALVAANVSANLGQVRMFRGYEEVALAAGGAG